MKLETRMQRVMVKVEDIFKEIGWQLPHGAYEKLEKLFKSALVKGERDRGRG